MIEILRSTAAYIVAVGVLVSFHEFGHFWVARRFGIKVLRFAVGFGKPLWRRTGKDGIEYMIGSIPLGGYVKLLDEREGPVAEPERARAFNRQPVAVRIAVFAAGPLFNFILAVILYWGMFVVGIPGLKPHLGEPPAGSAAAAAGLHSGDRVINVNGREVQTFDDLRESLIGAVLGGAPLRLAVVQADGQTHSVSLDVAKVRVDPQYLFDDLGLEPFQAPVPPVLGSVQPDSPAAQSGFKPGDRVLAADGTPVNTFDDLKHAIAGHAGQVIRIDVQRGGQSLSLEVIPAPRHSNGEAYVGIGIASPNLENDPARRQELAEQRYNPLAAVPEALRKTGSDTVLVVEFLYRMVLGEISLKNISGPINTAQVAGISVSIGLSAFLGFLAFVSLNLGIVNLLPVPVLDGGQIMFGLVEAVKGSPLSERAQAFGQQIGIVLMMLLMGLAFYNDFARFMG
jgi:regulator of sigma E protease